MRIVDCRKNAPEAVYLRVVSGEFGKGKKESCDEETECDRRHEGVGGEVNFLQAGEVLARFADCGREGLQLRKEREDSTRERGAVRDGLDVRKRERHFEGSGEVAGSTGEEEGK